MPNFEIKAILKDQVALCAYRLLKEKCTNNTKNPTKPACYLVECLNKIIHAI